MKKAAVIQSPKHYFDVVHAFYEALLRHDYFDRLYVITDVKKVNLKPDLEFREYLEKKSGQSSAKNPTLEVIHIKLDKDYNFTENVRRSLDKVEEDIFFMDCEDHVLFKSDWNKMDMCFDAVKNNPRIGCVRIGRKNKIRVKDEEEFITEVIRGKKGTKFAPRPFGACLQPTVWKKQFLKDVLGGVDAWQFEKVASENALNHKTMRPFVTNQSGPRFHRYGNWMKRGGYLRRGYVKFNKRMDIDFDETRTADYQKQVLGKKLP